jgi:hypothetical protein
MGGCSLPPRELPVMSISRRFIRCPTKDQSSVAAKSVASQQRRQKRAVSWAEAKEAIAGLSEIAGTENSLLSCRRAGPRARNWLATSLRSARYAAEATALARGGRCRVRPENGAGPEARLRRRRTMIHQPSSRALAIARGLVRTKRASSGAVFEGAANHFLRLPTVPGTRCPACPGHSAAPRSSFCSRYVPFQLLTDRTAVASRATSHACRAVSGDLCRIAAFVSSRSGDGPT